MTTPGEILRERIKALGITQEQFGKSLKGFHWVTLNRIIRGHDRITPQVALILAKAFSTTPQYWLHLQADYDLQKHLASLATTKLGKKQSEIIERTRVFE